MIRKNLFWIFILFLFSKGFSQGYSENSVNLAGVFQGKPLFIQNPFDKDTRRFCIDIIYLNEKALEINYQVSALQLDFSGYNLYTPVKLQIIYKDVGCVPIIINPEAILFHTIFRFTSIRLTDSALVWKTKGEIGIGEFEIEKLSNFIWIKQKSIPAIGKYEESIYSYFPNMDEGANKYRIKYKFPSISRSKYLFSWEFDYDHYPIPIDFRPKNVKKRLYLSRSTHYEIYDASNTLILSGQGNEIDITSLRRGQYVIYFNGKDPGSFIKE